jgi:hypothetical protein
LKIQKQEELTLITRVRPDEGTPMLLKDVALACRQFARTGGDHRTCSVQLTVSFNADPLASDDEVNDPEWTPFAKLETDAMAGLASE